MNILITTPTYPPFNSGLGNVVQRQASVLVANGFNVVVATGGGQRAQRKDEESGALVEEFYVSGADSWLNPIRGDVNSYVSFLAESDFDIVLMNAWQTWSTDLCLRNLSKVSGRKVLFSHCLSTNVFFWKQPFRSFVRYLLWRPYWWKLSKRLRKLDGFIVNAEEGCDSRFDDLRVAQRLGIPYKVVSNALSPEAVACFEQAEPELRSRSYLIAVGSYHWQKGFDFAIRAYARSHAKNIIPLKVFGQHFSRYTEGLRKLALSLGISNEYLSFHEGVSGAALIEEYKHSIAMISGSHTECQPLVLLDAMATGTPFVARLTGCIQSLPGGVGVGSEVEAANAINRLIKDGVEWSRLSNAGRECAKMKHHPDNVGKVLVSALLAV